MNAKDVIKATIDAGMKISKAKLTDALKKSTEVDFYFVKDSQSKYAVVRVPIPD